MRRLSCSHCCSRSRLVPHRRAPGRGRPTGRSCSRSPSTPRSRTRAGQHRGIDVAGTARRDGPRARRRGRLVRGHRAGQRQVRDDRDRRRLVGDAHPPRLDRCHEGRVGRRGRRRRDDRAERRAGAERCRYVHLGVRRTADEFGYVDPAGCCRRGLGLRRIGACGDVTRRDSGYPGWAGQPPVEPALSSRPPPSRPCRPPRVRVRPVDRRLVPAGLAASGRRPAGSRGATGAVRVAARRRSGGRRLERGASRTAGPGARTLQGGVAHPFRQLREWQIALQPGPQSQGIGEEADEPFDLAAAAARDWCAGDQIFLSAIAGEEDRKDGEKNHEGREPAGPSGLLQPLPCVQRQENGGPAAAPARHRGTRPVGWQIERGRRAGQVLLPPGELLGQHLPLQPGPLPHREVGVLNRQLRPG